MAGTFKVKTALARLLSGHDAGADCFGAGGAPTYPQCANV
jgi:hypothetical protein